MSRHHLAPSRRGPWRAPPGYPAPLVAALLLAVACGDERPNVLLVTVDTLRADRLGVYGDSRGTSPEIDAFAARGVIFERGVAAASTTAPSHASIFTSRFTRQHTVGHLNDAETRLERDPTVAELFRAAGWGTGAFVGNYLLQRRMGFDRGFDVFDSQLDSRPHLDVVIFERRARGTTRRALEWLAEERDAPFFLWVHYQDPHGPYTPPPAIAERFRVEPAPEERPLPVARKRFARDHIPSYQALPGLDRPSAYESRYAAEVFYVDRWLGKLLRAVSDHPSGRDAIVLLTADHGESLGEDGIYFDHSHGTTPDLAWVPMILSAPGLPPGRRDGLVSHVDVMPTLLELAGLPVPSGARGIALGPYVRDGRPLPDRTVYCDVGTELSAYRGDRFARLRNVSPFFVEPDAIPDRAAAPDGDTPGWSAYAWNADGSWAPADGELADEVRDYLREPLEPVYLDALTREDAERLRALGYW